VYEEKYVEISRVETSRTTSFISHAVQNQPTNLSLRHNMTSSLFGWLVADGWCWFVLREEYCWLVAGG
jgi:hypothetical protein